MNVTVAFEPSSVKHNVGEEVSFELKVYSDKDFHCNAADIVVEFDPNVLELVSATSHAPFQDARFFTLIEFTSSGTKFDSNLKDGDFGCTFWGPMLGSDVTKYPLVSSAGLSLGTFVFKTKAAGSGFVRASHSGSRLLSHRTWIYDASAPNFKRFPNTLTASNVEVA